MISSFGKFDRDCIPNMQIVHRNIFVIVETPLKAAKIKFCRAKKVGTGFFQIARTDAWEQSEEAFV